MELKGYLFSSDGSAIAGADVSAYVVGQTTAADTTTTDSDGHWAFTGLSAAKYKVEAEDGGSVHVIYPDTIWQAEAILDLVGVWKYQVAVGQLQPSDFTGTRGQQVSTGTETEFAGEPDTQGTGDDSFQTALSGEFRIDGRYRVKFEIRNKEDDEGTQARISVTRNGQSDWSETFSATYPNNQWRAVEYDFSESQAVSQGDTIRIQWRRTSGNGNDTAYIRNIQILGNKSAKDDILEFIKD